MTSAQFKAVEAISRRSDGSERHPRLVEQFGFRARVAAEFTTDRDAHKPHETEHFNVVVRAIDAGRAELLALHRSGRIHDRVLRSLEQELDLQQMVAETHVGWAQRCRRSDSPSWVLPLSQKQETQLPLG